MTLTYISALIAAVVLLPSAVLASSIPVPNCQFDLLSIDARHAVIEIEEVGWGKRQIELTRKFSLRGALYATVFTVHRSDLSSDLNRGGADFIVDQRWELLMKNTQDGRIVRLEIGSRTTINWRLGGGESVQGKHLQTCETWANE